MPSEWIVSPDLLQYSSGVHSSGVITLYYELDIGMNKKL